MFPSNRSPYRVEAIEYSRGLCFRPLDASIPGGMTLSDCPVVFARGIIVYEN